VKRSQNDFAAVQRRAIHSSTFGRERNRAHLGVGEFLVGHPAGFGIFMPIGTCRRVGGFPDRAAQSAQAGAGGAFAWSAGPSMPFEGDEQTGLPWEASIVAVEETGVLDAPQLGQT